MADFTDQLPPEMQAEFAGLLARRRIAEHMASRGAGGYIGAMGNARLQGTEPQMVDLAKRYQEGLQGAVKDYMTTRAGGTFNRPTNEVPVGTGETSQLDQNDYTRAPEQVAGNPMEATVKAFSSGYGPLQAIASRDLQNQQINMKDLLSLDGYDAKSKVMGATLLAQGLPIAAVLQQLGPKKQIIQHEGAVGAVSPDDNSVTTIGTLGGKELPQDWEKALPQGATRGPLPGQYYVKTPEGNDLYEMNFTGGKFTGSKKLDNAPKISTHVDARQSGPKIGAQEYFKQAGKDVGDLADRARAAQDVKNSVAQMANLDSRGVFSNVSSGPATFMANLTQAAGIQLTPQQAAGLQNTETYNAIATDAWQKLVAQYGGNRGVTKEEAEQIKQILPLTRNSPQARQQLYGILNQVADRNISRFRVANAAYARALGSDDPSIWAKHLEETFLPTVPSMPASKLPSPESFGGRKVQ